MLGEKLGCEDGTEVGAIVGISTGCFVGFSLGCVRGTELGELVGLESGCFEGMLSG